MHRDHPGSVVASPPVSKPHGTAQSSPTASQLRCGTQERPSGHRTPQRFPLTFTPARCRSHPRFAPAHLLLALIQNRARAKVQLPHGRLRLCHRRRRGRLHLRLRTTQRHALAMDRLPVHACSPNPARLSPQRYAVSECPNASPWACWTGSGWTSRTWTPRAACTRQRATVTPS